MSQPKRAQGRKLLIASIGVATASYIGCGGGETSGNLIAPPCDPSCNEGGGGAGDGGQGGGTSTSSSTGTGGTGGGMGGAGGGGGK
jgi:hypothetical protein